MLLEELLEAIPADTEQRVRRTRDRFNPNIREAIRQETGLRFRPKTRTGDLQSTELISIPIQLVPGLPTLLRHREIQERGRIAALLAPWKNTLEQLSVAAYEARQLIRVVPIPHSAAADDHLDRARLFAEELLEKLRKFRLAQWILEIDQDVLGAYFFCIPPGERPLRHASARRTLGSRAPGFSY